MWLEIWTALRLDSHNPCIIVIRGTVTGKVTGKLAGKVPGKVTGQGSCER